MSRAKDRARPFALFCVLACSRPCFAEEPDAKATPEVESETATAKDPLEGPRSHAVQKDVVPDARGLSIALRAGWGAPQGSVERGTRLSEAALGVVPLWLDLGYRLSPRWLLGVYAQYAFVAGPDCPESVECRGSDVRFGLQAQWHFGSRASTDPWIGLGTGFELYERKGETLTERFAGFELANLQFGQDWSLGRRFALGPFVSLSLDRFTSVERSSAGARTDVSIDHRAWHGWMLLGLRFSFGA